LYGNKDYEMILPGSYVFSILLLVLTLLCWGSWANLFKLAGKWRFELFYLDFAVGVGIAAIVAALTFGSLGWDGFGFTDNLQMAGRRQDLYAFLAGCVFNLANLLLLAAVSVAGMSVAFPVVMGLGLVVATIWSLFGVAGGSPLLLSAGCVAIVAACVFDALAHREYTIKKLAKAPPPEPSPAAKSKGARVNPKRGFTYKAILLSVAGGLVMGSFYPLLDLARNGENGLGPYAGGFVFAIGVGFSTFVFNLFFMNLPVQGKPIEISEYFKGKVKQHAAGLVGGMVWYAGAVSSFVVARADGPATVTPAVMVPLTQSAALVAALWGLLAWHEYAGAENKVKTYIAAMFFLLVVGVGIISVAPLFSGS